MGKRGTIAVTPLERYVAWKAVAAKYRIPSYFMEALSKGESGWKADAVTGSYVGLCQVGTEVLSGYNQANKTAHAARERLDPRLNALFCGWQLRTIANAYTRSGIPELREDWSSMEWQAMLTAGWNSGWSRRKGVLKVAHYLQDNKISVTHANLFRHSKQADGTKHLANKTKRRWQRLVALRSFRIAEA